MARTTTTRGTRGKTGGTAKAQAGRGAKAATPRSKAAPAPVKRLGAKPASAAAKPGKQNLVARVEQLERATASLRTRHSEMKRAIAALTARLAERDAAPTPEAVKPRRRQARVATTPADASEETLAPAGVQIEAE